MYGGAVTLLIFVVLLVLVVAPLSEPTLSVFPATSRGAPGLAVPMPTLPLAAMSIELVGAPGRIRKDKRDPPVRSRTKKLASLAPMSHVCAVKPPVEFCSSRIAGVSLVFACISNNGVAVRNPTLLLLPTLIELAEAPASTAKTIVPVSEFPVAP